MGVLSLQQPLLEKHGCLVDWTCFLSDCCFIAHAQPIYSSLPSPGVRLLPSCLPFVARGGFFPRMGLGYKGARSSSQLAGRQAHSQLLRCFLGRDVSAPLVGDRSVWGRRGWAELAPGHLGLRRKRDFALPAGRASNKTATSLCLLEKQVSMRGLIFEWNKH